MAIKMPSQEDLARARAKAEHERAESDIVKYAAEIKEKPNDSQLRYRLAVTYMNVRRFAEARKEFKEALQIDPKFIHAWVNLATVHYELGDYDKSIESNRTALEISPGFLPARANLGLSLMAQGRYSEAIEELEKVTKVEPMMPVALAGLYQAHGALKHGEEMRKYRMLAEKAGVRFQ